VFLVQELEAAAKRIRNMEIQGATQVALFAMDSMIAFAQRHSDKTIGELIQDLRKAEKLLHESRDTEPGIRNGFLYLIGQLRVHQFHDGAPASQALDLIEKSGVEFKELINNATKKIARFGSRIIPGDHPHFTIQTIGNSSIVDAILQEAHNQGKKFSVIVSETRPSYQGRTTAKKLVEMGIDTTQSVDGAMRWIAKHSHPDLILVGAQSITSEGTILNKIGTKLLANVSLEAQIPFYVATSLLKYNPATAFGVHERIEMRDPNEILKSWENYPVGIKVLNPAFEVVGRTAIHGLITEAGIFPSGAVHQTFIETYPNLFKVYKELEQIEEFD